MGKFINFIGAAADVLSKTGAVIGYRAQLNEKLDAVVDKMAEGIEKGYIDEEYAARYIRENLRHKKVIKTFHETVDQCKRSAEETGNPFL